MAQKVSILLVDDIDGSEAVETVKFGLDGAQYEIDLGTKHADELRALAAPYIDKARRITGPARRPARTRNTAANGADPGRIREWAKENGFEVSDRGRVPGDVVAKYEAAVGA
jgi:hypothetical protein